MDPQEQFASPFSYAGNNPVMMTDPDGQFGFLAAALAGAVSSGIRYASNLSQTGGDWNWNDFGKTVGLAAASAGLSSGFSDGMSSVLYHSKVNKQTADYIGGFGANLIAGTFASGGIPNDPAQIGAILGSSISNAGFYSNPKTVSRELLDQVPWSARNGIWLDPITIEDARESKWPWWWGNTPYVTNPVTKAVIDGQRAGAAVVFEVASILAPVPKIGLLAKGYRFLRGAKAAKAARASTIITRAVGAAPRGFSKFKSINQLNKLVQTGKLPKTITRFDKGKILGELDHVHFRNGSALNINGTWKHSSKILTNKEIKILTQNGWALPR